MNKPKQGDAIRWINGKPATIKMAREQDGETVYCFHELTCEYTYSQLMEMGVFCSLPQFIDARIDAQIQACKSVGDGSTIAILYALQGARAMNEQQLLARTMQAFINETLLPIAKAGIIAKNN
jgi:hypothetical protein